MKNDKLTLAVPTYASPQYRQLLKLASKLAGYKSTTILETTTAVATYYSIEKIKKGSRKPITILFIDIGAENAEVSLWKYRPLGEKLFMELLQYRHTSGVGGNIVDRLILNHVSPLLGRPLVGSEKFIVMNLLRKAKERLAGGSSIGVDLNEDFGKYITINQSDIQMLTQNMTEKMVELISDITPPDEIELIGGSSRLQVFIDAITKAFPDIPIRRSLNSDEACTLGAAYYTALRSGTIIGAKIELKKPAVFGLNATIDDENVEIFQPGDTIKEKKVPMIGKSTHLVKLTLDTDVYDEYVIDSREFNSTNSAFSNVMLGGIEKALGNVKATITNNTVPTFSLKFGHSFETDTFDLIDASIVVNVTVNRRSLAKKGCGMTNFKELKIPFVSIPGDPAFRVPPNSSTFLSKMMRADADRLKREEACHSLEAFIIETRDAASYESEMFPVTTKKEREKIIKILDKARTEVDCTNLDADETSDTLERKLRNIRADILHPLERYEEAVKRPSALMKLMAAVERAEDAKKHAQCENDTLEHFVDKLNQTYTRLERLKKDGPYDTPSFLVSDMKDFEKDLLKRIPEVRRPAKKREVINFSTNNQTDMDDEEYERLKSAGISVNKPKKKRKQDTDPEIKALKEKRVFELEKVYNNSKAAFNQSRKLFVQRRKAFEKEHNLQIDPWREPDELNERNKFRDELEYYERLEKKQAKIRAKEEAIRKAEEERLRQIEEEKNRPPTPTPTAEEAKRLQKEAEEKARIKAEEEANRKRIEEEKNMFLEAGQAMLELDELDQNEDELYEKYKKLKKRFENDSHHPFDDDDEREKYMAERKEYEDLRRKFDNDPERKRKEMERKKAQKKKREEREAREAEKTELDEKIEDLEVDQKRLERDLQFLKEDIRDFENLERQILRKELHDKRKKERRNERERKAMERRSRSWEERKHNLISDSETDSNEESPTSFYDDIPDFSELDLLEEPESSFSSSSSSESSSSCFSSSATESSAELNRIRKQDYEIECRKRDRLKLRHLIDPEHIKYNMTKKEIKEIKKNGFRIPNPKELYSRRFSSVSRNYDEEYEREKGEKHRIPPLNPDEGLQEKRETQEDELGEEL
ncbi:hypothetical protein TRFO_15618 [Tritrichomonas foetus]|uniref:DnaK protein n=1 Tax=Tritrichomonas foetus TaxID=1144522 RepID=A0A1J4KWK4_9EUKA|nr:hypothetical protein TRFO_15618 [Tritrichomonas foetus]|eukprot:OHT14086.1 hypothetical protein TRFO_15618 [Tritrichomonas foetus]